MSEPQEKKQKVISVDDAIQVQRNVLEIEGLSYMYPILTKDEEKTLLACIDQGEWRKDLSRRVQHYGWIYNYRERSVKRSDYLGPLPKWVDFLLERFKTLNIETEYNQIIVNEYMPGQGIGAHIDQPQIFGDDIISVSLGSAVSMEFSQNKNKHELRLEPCSAIMLSGPARYKWTHCIPARKIDVVDKKVILRKRRVSLTFRRVINT